MHLPTPELSSYALKKLPDWDELQRELLECLTLMRLERLRREWMVKMWKDNWNAVYVLYACREFDTRKAQIINDMTDEERQRVSLVDQLYASLEMENRTNGTTEE